MEQSRIRAEERGGVRFTGERSSEKASRFSVPQALLLERDIVNARKILLI